MRTCKTLGFRNVARATTVRALQIAASYLLLFVAHLILAASFSIGGGVTPAYAQFSGCNSRMWLVQYGTLYTVGTATNPFTYTQVGSAAATNYNGADYNPSDNFIYAMSFKGGETNHVLRIRPDGSTVDLGAITGLPLAGNYRSGAFSPTGNILYVIGANTSNRLYRINITAKSATSVNLTRSVDIADLAWVGTNLYAVEAGGQLISINPTSGAVTSIGTAPGPAGYYGAMFGAPNGLFGSYNSGGFYQFDLTTGARTLLSNFPGADSNDGMHCPAANLAFGAEVSVTKTDGSPTYTPGAKSVYTIEVSNAGPFGAQGVRVSDPLPANIPAGSVTWTCSASAGAGCSASGSGAINDIANLPPNSKATYKLTIDVPASYTGPLTNTVTITVPDTVIGDNPANNTASDTNISVPKLTLQKQVINEKGGTRTPADFTLTATGPTPISGAHGSATVTAAPVQAGTYALGENNLHGYVGSDYVCSINGGAQVTGNSITLANEQTAVCSITNRDQPARLTLGKIVRNDHGGTAAIADFPLTATGPTPISGVSGSPGVTAAEVFAGAYTLSEANLPGYSSGAFVCTVNGGGAVTGNSLNLGSGDDAVCTVTNSDQPARLTLIKQIVNDYGGTATLQDFTLSAAGPTPISGASGTPAVTAVTVASGSYTLSETNLPGYTASDFSCTVNGGAAASGNALTLANGDSAVCTVTNTVQPARLTLAKTVVNSHGGTATPANFTLTADGPATISGVTGAPAVTNAAVPAGSYTLREANLPGYTGADYSCVVNGGAAVSGNTLNLANGDSAVCTIENRDNPASLTLAKVLNNTNGGIATPTDFTLTATGPTTISGATGGPTITAASVPAGTYVLSETNLPGYTASAYSCVINGAPAVSGNSVTLIGSDVAVCTIVNSDIAPTVTIKKTLTGESISPDEVPQPNEVLTYQITLTNTGGTASNYSLTDVLDENVIFLTADNAPAHIGNELIWSNLTVPAQNGATPGVLVLTVSVQVPSSFPAGVTSVTNIAKRTSDPDPPCPSNQCVQISAPPNVTLLKELIDESITRDKTPEPNEQLTYRLTLTNTGGTAINYALTDKIDGNVTFVSSTHGGNPGGEGIEWNGLTVPGQVGATPGTLIVEVVVQVSGALTPGAIVTNLVKPTGAGDPPCPSAQCIQIPDPARVTITKTLESNSGPVAGIAEPNSTLTYKITLTNNGGGLTGFNVSDKLDVNTTFQSADNGGAHGAGVVQWNNLTVPAYNNGPGILDLRVVVRVNTPLPAGTTQVANVAFETGQPEPPCPSQQCVTLQTPGVIAIDKQLVGESGTAPGVAEAGETLTYQITLTNSGGPTSTLWH